MVEARVRDAMFPYQAPLDEGHLLVDALNEMKRRNVGALPVVASDGSLKGILVRRDGDKVLREDATGRLTVGEACRSGVSVGLDDSLQAALALLQAEQVGSIPVVHEGRPAGGISRGVIRSYLERQQLEPLELSRVRWREAQPNEALTWGKPLSGEAFVAKAEFYGAFAADKAILEIGPGYGRLLNECFRRRLPFGRYVAVDVSPTNVAYLSDRFDSGEVEVIVGDIETVALDQRFDVVLSSLTLKHLYPSFEAALRNVERHLNPGATVIFDLIEGHHRGFSRDGRATYIRAYSRAEVRGILAAIPLELVALDEVEHDPENVRLLVVARKPPG